MHTTTSSGSGSRRFLVFCFYFFASRLFWILGTSFPARINARPRGEQSGHARPSTGRAKLKVLYIRELVSLSGNPCPCPPSPPHVGGGRALAGLLKRRAGALHGGVWINSPARSVNKHRAASRLSIPSWGDIFKARRKRKATAPRGALKTASGIRVA